MSCHLELKSITLRTASAKQQRTKRPVVGDARLCQILAVGRVSQPKGKELKQHLWQRNRNRLRWRVGGLRRLSDAALARQNKGAHNCLGAAKKRSRDHQKTDCRIDCRIQQTRISQRGAVLGAGSLACESVLYAAAQLVAAMGGEDLREGA